MRNPLQDQLLKAGLVKKGQVADVVREKNRQRKAKGKGKQPAETPAVDVDRLQAERAERDRAIAAERNERARANERRAQVRQIVESHKVKREGEIEYRFSDGDRIKSVLVNDALRSQLAGGALAIVRHDDGYELLPRAAAEKVRDRDASMIVVDHGHDGAQVPSGEDDEYYSRFKVPDDLIW